VSLLDEGSAGKEDRPAIRLRAVQPGALKSLGERFFVGPQLGMLAHERDALLARGAAWGFHAVRPEELVLDAVSSGFGEQTGGVLPRPV